MMDNKTILVMIASYKDDELLPTIHNAIDNANDVDRVHFALCYQDEVDAPYYKELKRIKNLRYIVIPPEDSKGCCFARTLTADLYDGEDYILQIDSHMRFVKGWDDKSIDMLNSCKSDKPLLTAYCPTFEEYDWYLEDLKNTDSPKTNTRYLGEGDMLPFGFCLMEAKGEIESDEPVTGSYISGHFIFAKADFIKEVPYDPELYFYGEEYSLSVRAYTNGWDIYYPNEAICFHKYGREEHDNTNQRKLHWFMHNSFLFDFLSKSKVKDMINGADFGIYGLGKARELS